ncbi:Pr6Pr family membrane protein [Ruminiclostridium cellobioparum]|jgi:hypothetical protein|uniref:Pr6Pr family membrane protein n=1 Tax=Ruminiclostridium cellobioparum TaxID=29355 RepID=UPI0004862E2B|nr:Pr6Pr family membrane protein [Ruminiclostridium cellobioparum]
MCIHNRLFALIFRILFLAGCGIGLYLNSGLPSGKPAPYMLIFYTIQSNALCFIFFAILIIKTFLDLKNKGIKGTTVFLPHFKGAVTMAIAVTFIIYQFVLVPKFLSAAAAAYTIFNWQNMLVHYFVPIAALTDWLVFDEKLNFRWFDPIVWLMLPIAYFIFILIRARFGGVIEIVKSPYPYFFIDVELLGWIKVIKNACLLIFGFLVLGYLIFIVDRVKIRRHSPKFDVLQTR